MAVRSTQCSTVVLSYLFLMFLVLLSTFDNIILIRSELVVSAINSQQHQQTQQIQQIQQHRKYYYHFRYNETSRSPSPQMTGLSKRRVDSDGDSAGSVVVDSDNVVEQQQQEQQQQHSDRQHKHEKLSGSSSSSSSSSNSIISSGIISNINSNSGSNKPLALKPLILLQQNIQQQQQQQQQQQLLEKQQQHQQDRHVVVGEKQQQQQQHSHSSINSFVHKDRDRENIVSSSASRTSAGGIISSRIAHQQLVRHNSDDENDDDDDDNSYDNKDDDDNNNIIKEVVSEEVYIYEYDFDIDNDRSSNNNNDDNSNKNNDYDEDEEDENSFGLEERENLIRHLEVSSSTIEFGVGHLCLSQNQTMDITNSDPDRSIQILAIRTDSPHFDCDFLSSYITDIYTNGGSFYLSLPNSSTQQQQQQQQQPPPQQQQPTMTNQQQTSTTTTNILSLLKSKPSTQSSSPSKSSTQSSTSSISTSSNSQSPTTTISASNNDLTSIWEIQPYSKSHVINLYFRSSFSGQFTGIINIETNVENIQVPTEILSVGDGVHVSPSEIDFGYITSKTDFKSVTLYFLSANHDQDLSIMEIHPEVPDPNLRFFLHYDVISPGKTECIDRSSNSTEFLLRPDTASVQFTQWQSKVKACVAPRRYQHLNI
ncbi:hypothetical protein PPL_11019 [Heterostelium album PN500]|uniref:Uncharacterized protein n=1 Tax=Heterostelium pallidum (strain ATCC 26659 / Pp 5 / PN500) TaxID=670386 RepID=D3BSQ0_HETP5|nr:hypothetical protein PPL_11019 [Heterostelium album PN500]EFA75515.1 hypothetical protein PPL_11019 [Heterostelium album PN500]|eukprot:XP_020427649.1 hypothetical protein PPL_11019 [Heterostelium album PN500]